MSEFGTLNLEDMQGEDSRLNDAKQQRRDDLYVPMPDVKPGSTGLVAVRILPPSKGSKLFQYTRLHMIKGRSIHCPKPLVNGKWDRNTPCPICDYYNELWRQADKLNDQGKKEAAERLQDEARSIKPIERYYYNAIVRNLTDESGNKQTNVGPRILSIGKVLHKMIVRAIVGDETEAALGDITHPKTGYDFLIKKEVRGTGKDGYPNYDRSAFARESSPLGTKEEIVKWVEGLHDLTTLRSLKDVDALEHELARHRGLIEEEESGFNIDKFDAKYGKSGAVSVPRNVSDEDAVGSVVANASTDDTDDAVPAPTATAPVEDVSVDDEDFLKELQGMNDDE